MYLGTITRQMKSTKKDIFNNLLTRKDFESKLEKLKKSQKSQFPTICAELCEMFDALGIVCKPRMPISYYEELVSHSDLPSFSNVEESILKTMFLCFDKYPTPETYMARIVKRLSNPEDGWSTDSLRLQILKRFLKYLNGCVYITPDGKKKSIYGWEKVIVQYTEKKGYSKRSPISDTASYVDEGIFDVYAKAIAQCQAKLTQAQNLPCILELRETIKTLKKEEQSTLSKEVLRNVKEALRDAKAALKEAEKKNIEPAKSELKKCRERYGLVKLADELSKGIFRAGGATKLDLYLFAIAFDMTYSTAKEAAPGQTTLLFDYESDIEKNLFEDYYANNLMRFITDAYETGNFSAFELDPSGRGINYKNFAEMVYLYFLSKGSETYTPIEKLWFATEMIQRLKKREPKDKQVNTSTQFYTTIFTEDILNLPEAKFEEFIFEHYDCKVVGKSEMQIQTSQKTAFQTYTNLIQKIEAIEAEQKSSEYPYFHKENCNYGLWFVDVSAFEKYGTHPIEKVLEKIDREQQSSNPEKIKQFLALLYGINMYIGHLFIETESNQSIEQEHTEPSKRVIKKMSIQKPEDMTRTALIVAYYYWYNQLNESRNAEKSFVDVMDDYTDFESETGLNDMLEKAGYQPINDRNIFDLAVIFSSYAYLSI